MRDPEKRKKQIELATNCQPTHLILKKSLLKYTTLILSYSNVLLIYIII